MKKIILTLTTLIAAFSFSFAQKYAYVDTEYILGKIPAYKTAQEELDELSKDYQKQVEDAYAEVEKLYKAFQAEKVLLTEEMRLKKEEEIIAKEKKAKDLQRKLFGKEGELFNKREELIKPIQDEVFNAIQEVAKRGNYAVIFDTAAGATILYSNPKYDKSDDVLENLGYKD